LTKRRPRRILSFAFQSKHFVVGEDFPISLHAISNNFVGEGAFEVLVNRPI
jgi:hypothetical protein